MGNVFGVFEETNLDEVVNHLVEKGYADDYRIVDRNNLKDERLLALPGQGTGSGASGNAGVLGVFSTREDQFPQENSVNEREFTDLTMEWLNNFNLSDEEATYYGRAILNGGSLIIVEVDGEHEEDVERLFREHGAQSVSEE